MWESNTAGPRITQSCYPVLSEVVQHLDLRTGRFHRLRLLIIARAREPLRHVSRRVEPALHNPADPVCSQIPSYESHHRIATLDIGPEGTWEQFNEATGAIRPPLAQTWRHSMKSLTPKRKSMGRFAPISRAVRRFSTKSSFETALIARSLGRAPRRMRST